MSGGSATCQTAFETGVSELSCGFIASTSLQQEGRQLDRHEHKIVGAPVDGATVLQLAQQPPAKVSTTNQCFCVTCVVRIIAMLRTQTADQRCENDIIHWKA